MSRRRFLAGAVTAALVPRFARAVTLEYGLDPIFEWMGTLARAAGFPEYRHGLEAWNTVLNPVLRRISAHRAVRMLQRARLTRALAWDAIPSMAAHLSGEPQTLVARVPFDPWPASLDSRWRGVAGPAFLAAASDAARVSDFGGLWLTHGALLTEVEVALARRVSGFDLGWYSSFFGTPLPARLRVVAMMTAGRNNYRARLEVDGARETFAVMGVTTSSGGAPAVADLPLLVHEVGHDFVNPVIEAHRLSFEPVGRRLYAANTHALARQAYRDASTVVSESVVRACVVRYLAAHGVDVLRELDNQRLAGFPWTGMLANALAEYEADRARWPTFADYVPALVAALGSAAEYAGSSR